eukprot:TRINITY_DN3697_c0_g2_i10.p1 TRINITY_DN3697_c0_g2~~TRINITY_DN3697_c0_g2_i10.p1  ORF type:complete len:434 (-),score=126.72 TRINITY_DN3697_c0_g2_i10:153-1454(-)
MIRRPPRSTLSSSSAASDVYKRQVENEPTTAPISTAAAEGTVPEESEVDEAVTDEIDEAVTDDIDEAVTDEIDEAVTDDIDEAVTDEIDEAVTDDIDEADVPQPLETSGSFVVQQEVTEAVCPLTLAALRPKISEMQQEVRQSLQGHEFDAAERLEQGLNAFLVSAIAQCSEASCRAADAHDFGTAADLEKCVGFAKASKTPKSFSKAATPTAARINELLTKYRAQATANRDKMSLASSAKNYREAKRLKENTEKISREAWTSTTTLYSQAVRAGGCTAAFKCLWESITGSLPEDCSLPQQDPAPTKKVAQPKRELATVVNTRVAKKIAATAVGDMVSRLSKQKKKHKDTHASQDESANCTFELNLKAVRRSVVQNKRTGEKWQPPSKGWVPGNAPITARSSNDGLYSVRQRVVGGLGNTMGNTMRSTSRSNA